MKNLSDLTILKGMVACFWMAIVILLVVVLSGCAAFSTEGENYAGLNRGTYVKANGDRWDIIGGKDGTNVNFKAETRPDGTATVTLTADNYDATTVLAQANLAMQERLEKLTQILIGMMGSPAP